MRAFDPGAWAAGPRRQHKQLIEGGRVYCPRRGDIDLEICLTCRDLETIVADQDPAFVCCRPTAPSLEALPLT